MIAEGVEFEVESKCRDSAFVTDNTSEFIRAGFTRVEGLVVANWLKDH
jgi:hypothetical protein